MTKVGVIGCGGMGNVHARKYTIMPDVELHFHDLDETKADAFEAAHGAQRHQSFESILETCDAVDICLPTDAHLSVGLRVLESGKPVLIEKPLARSVEQCQQLIEAQKGIAMVGQVVRFFPEYRRAHDLVQKGELGTPAVVRMRRGGKAPAGSGGWFQDLARSGGVLLDLAVHEFDWLVWTFGEVQEVNSRSVRLGGKDVPGDYALTTLKFKSGCIGHVESTWLDPSGFRVTFEVCGSSGMLHYDSRSVGTVRTHTANGSVSESPLAAQDDPFFKQLRHFVNVVQGTEEPTVSLRDGLAAVKIAEAAIESASTRKTTRISD